MTNVLHEIHLADGAVELEDGLLWKEILRECSYPHTPGPKGLEPRPFSVVKTGASEVTPGHLKVSMEELVNNFDSGAFRDNVTLPLTDEPGTDHKKDIARFNTGFVKRLKIVEKDGVSRLLGGMDFTEDEIGGKCQRGTIRNCSSGVYVAPEGFDGLALKHVALTNSPFIKDLEPFGQQLAASDEAEDFDEIVPISIESEQKYHRVKIIEQFGRKYAAPYRKVDGEEDISPPHLWFEVDWLTPAPETTPDPSSEEEVSEEETHEPPAAVAASEHEAGSLQWASRQRQELLSRNANNPGGPKLPSRNIADALTGLELSDEQRQAIQALQEKADRGARIEREAKVDRRIAELGDAGWKDQPGFLKAIRQLLLADDGETAAVVELSDDPNRSDERSMTVTEAIEHLLAALPKPEETRSLLASQLDPLSATTLSAAPGETDQEVLLAKARDFYRKPAPAARNGGSR
jgi:hypothetical protein